MSQSLEQGKRKLTAKDAITAGALGAVCIAIRFVFMLVGGVSPYVWFATHFIDAILIGPVFMLMVAKVRKNGPFLLTSLVTGVVLVAATWMFPITGLVGGLLCELCLRAGQFRQKGWLVLGFFCFNLGFIGDFLPLWFTKESYLEYAAQMMDAGYMATMEGLLTWPVFGIIVLSILVGSILGALLGMKLMRKHFVKAGLATMRTRAARGSFLDPTDQNPDLAAGQCGGVHLGSGGVPHRRDAGLLRPVPAGAEGKDAGGPAAGLPGHRGSAVLAVAAAARLPCHGLCHSDLFHSGLSLHCRRGLHHCHHQRQPVHGRSGAVGGAPEFFHHSGGDPPVSAGAPPGLPAYPGRHGPCARSTAWRKNWSVSMSPMLMGAAQTAEELSESANRPGH